MNIVLQILYKDILKHKYKVKVVQRTGEMVIVALRLNNYSIPHYKYLYPSRSIKWRY